MPEKYDVFQIDMNVANELLYNYYQKNGRRLHFFKMETDSAIFRILKICLLKKNFDRLRNLLQSKNFSENFFDFTIRDDYKERWHRSRSSGVPVEAINFFTKTRNIETRYLPLLYLDLFGEIPPEEAEDRLLEMLGKKGGNRNDR